MSKVETLEEAVKKAGGKINRYVLRLGKNDEEAGKFEPWAILPKDFPEDFQGFLACLSLVKLIDSVTERMKGQRKGVREAKKIQKTEQKEIAKAQAKADKEAAKAQLKLDRAAERARIKEDAKRAREEAKHAKNNPIVQVVQEVQGVEQAEVQVPTVLRQVGGAEPGQVSYEEESVVVRHFNIPEEG